ncbi:glycosyltransferase family A protein [uncultured Sphingomonas sp.]|uniref:glycosyltransferase family A protein n=1 Tax=uncultured Sphingomonas sp. TaxID=158754 RepID=UPI0035CC6651
MADGDALIPALISIVVPAYNRPEQLFEAIQSCFDQQYRPIEILVSDDSADDAVGEMVAAIEPPPGISLAYRRNRPGKGQSGNVNALFAMARGRRLVILHDDDLLLPGGLDRLDEEWRAFADPVCVFGKQVVIHEDGAVAIGETLAVNRRYHRARKPTAVQRPSETVGLLQQIPNDCFLVDAALARSVGYRPESEVGLAADSDFGIRLALAAPDREFVLVDAYVSAYRINRDSMMRWTHRNQAHPLMFVAVEQLRLPPEAENARRIYLNRLGPAAVLDAANAGDLALARRIFRSTHYRRSPVSVHRLVAMISIASPTLGAALRPFLKSAVHAMRRWPWRWPSAQERLPRRDRAIERAAIQAVMRHHVACVRARRAAFTGLARGRATA